MSKKRPKVEVHVGTICIYNDKCLVIKRSKDKRLYPELWECGGGKVHPGETFEEAAVREVREELGAEVEILDTVGVYSIDVPDRDQKVIPGVKLLCKIEKFDLGDKPKLSEEHTEWRLIDENEISDINFIPGVDQDVKEAFERYQRIGM